MREPDDARELFTQHDLEHQLKDELRFAAREIEHRMPCCGGCCGCKCCASSAEEPGSAQQYNELGRGRAHSEVVVMD